MRPFRLLLLMAAVLLVPGPATRPAEAGQEAGARAPGADALGCRPPEAHVGLRNGGVVGPASPPAACRAPVAGSSLPPSRVQRLGRHTVGETVAFTVPPDTGSISIVEQAVGAPPETVEINFPGFSFPIPNAAVPTLLTAPDGTVLYDDNAPLPFDLSTAHAVTFPSAYTGTMTLPNTTRALRESRPGGYLSGEWSFQVNDYALECATPPISSFCSGGSTTDRYDVTVFTEPLVPRKGGLDVAVSLASDSLTASVAVESPAMRRYADTLSDLYGQAGVCVSRVTVYDLPAWAKARYATGIDVEDLGPCSNFSQLFTLSQAADELPLFFVDAIQFGGGGFGEIVGIDGAIPGPASLGGTVKSGVVVNASDLAAGRCGGDIDVGGCGADLVAYISAHEGGHFMGLFHTTEAFGNAFDPLRDTPRCLCSTACLSAEQASLCANGQLVLTADVCSQAGNSQCAGADNLMFWLLEPPFSRGNLSPEQGQVMRANPVVH